MVQKVDNDSLFNTGGYEIAWRPMRSVRDLTLSDQDLQKACPLSHHRSCEKPKYDLGSLDMLPLEILNMILAWLDIHSLMSLQRINRRGFALIHGLPQLMDIFRHCPDVLRGILSTEIAPYIGLSQLVGKLSSTACESCDDFGGYLYLLTCSRVCFHCFTQLPHYLPILRSEARRLFGVSTSNLKHLPRLKSVPGFYTIRHKSHRSRVIVVDSDTAREAGTGDIRQRATRTIESSTTTDNANAGAESPHTTTPPFMGLDDAHEYNFRRFIAVVEIPYLDLRSSRADWGFCCYACRNDPGGIKYSRRQFLPADFRRHLRQCGKVRDGRHMDPADEDED